MTHHWGYVGAITAAVLFGVSATLNKIVLSHLHPMVIAGLIYLIAGIVLFGLKFSPLREKILLLLRSDKTSMHAFSKRDFQILALVIVCGSLIAPILFMFGLKHTTAVSASLLLSTESLFTVGIAFVFLKERAIKKDYMGMALIIIGAVFVTTAGEFQGLELTRSVFGNFLVLSACMFWGVDNNLSKIISRKKDLILLTALKCSIGGFILLSTSLILGLRLSLPLILLPYIFIVGSLSIGFSVMLFLFALREIGAMKTAVIFSTSSLIGALFAFIILNEQFTTAQAVAGTAMLYGVYLLCKKPPTVQHYVADAADS